MKYSLYLLGLLTVIFGVISYELYSQNQKLNRIVYANYTNELANTSERMNHLRNAVHQSLLYHDEVALNEELSTINRLSSEIKQSINQLPIDDSVRVEWSHYLTRLGTQADHAKNDTTGNWHKVMASASANIDELVQAWQDTSYQLFAMNGKVKDWDALHEGKPVQAFAQHSNLLSGYRETDFPLTASESDEEKKRDLQFLMDKEITKDEAVQRIQTLFPQIQGSTMTISRNRDSSKYDFYHIQFVKGARIGYADITVKGGHVISFLLERPVSKEVKSHEQIKQSAEQFIQNAGFTDVVYTEARENHTAWHFVYTRKVDDLLVYPDSIQIKVAKDTGEVIGMNAMEYIQKEMIPNHKTVPLDVSTFFQSNVTVADMKQIVTNNAHKEPRICYEIIAYRNGAEKNAYRIVIDAESHNVQKVEALT